MLAAGVHSLSVNYQYYTIPNPFIRSTAVSEKKVFRVGKKALAEDILFDKFWSCGRYFARLGNVYGFRKGRCLFIV